MLNSLIYTSHHRGATSPCTINGVTLWISFFDQNQIRHVHFHAPGRRLYTNFAAPHGPWSVFQSIFLVQ